MLQHRSQLVNTCIDPSAVASPSSLWQVKTFHSIACELLRDMLALRKGDESGRSSAFTIFDDNDSLAVTRQLVKKVLLTPSDAALKQI